MLFSDKKFEKHLLISISENINMHNSRIFSNNLSKILKENADVDFLSLDMKNVDFLDSSGIGVILRTAVRAKSQKITTNLFNLNHSILSILKLSGIQKMLNIYEGEEFFNTFSEIRESIANK